MIQCSYCQCSFENIQLLLNHIANFHGSLKHFKCFFDNCNRVYSLYQSFRKHILHKHTLFSTSEPSIVESPVLPNECHSSDFQNDKHSDVYYSSDSDSDVSIIDDVTDSLEEINTFGDDTEEMHIGPTWEKNLKIISLNYTASLYNLKKVSRKCVNDVIHETKKLLNEISTLLKQEICSLFKDLDTTRKMDDLNKLFDNFSNCLAIVDTEQKRFTQYKKLETFIEPISYNIGERVEYRKVNSIQTLVHVPVNAQFIPLRKVLKQFFELPGIYCETMQYVNSLNSNTEIISNFIQGTFWKERLVTFNGKNVLPLIIYFDDYENNNPLGAHKGLAKTGAVYISIPVLPPQYQAKLENIFVFLLFNTLDRTAFKHPVIFTRAIEELNFLNEYGIEIDIACQKKKIYFEVVQFVGDNLGLHSILGLTESFKANVFCHHCLTTQSEKNTIFQEKECTLRTVDNYESLLSESDPKISGIKERCIFHKLHNFHITKNISADVMHDLLEGVCRYDVALIINHFIFNMQLFSLTEFNMRLQGFDYGSKYNINKPPEFNEKSVKKGCIIISSSEMFCLIQNLPVIIGDLIPIENEHWELFVLLREIITIVSSNELHPLSHEQLETNIYEYLSLFTTLFPNSFKPKHHFLVHYPRCMKQFGPLWKLCCLRFESKNQEGKGISKSTTSRININKTIAVKHQLFLNYRFMTKKASYSLFTSKTVKNQLVSDLKYYRQFSHLLEESRGLLMRSLDYMGKTIKKDCILVIFSYSGPAFHRVYEIIMSKSKYVFITKKFNDYYFDYHLQAFKIYNLHDFSWDIVLEEHMERSIITNIVQLSNSFYYVSKNWI